MDEEQLNFLMTALSRDGFAHTFAYLSDLNPAQDGTYVQQANSLGTNLNALDTAIANVAAVDWSLTLETKPTPDPAYAAQYELKQRGQTIGTINIPKDTVVGAGSIVDIAFSDESGTPQLLEDGVVVTAAIKGDVVPTAEDAGKYIKLTITNKANAAIYVRVADLVTVYTAQQNAAQVQLAISANNEISATIVAGSVGTNELANGAVTLNKLSSDVQTSLSNKADKDANATADHIAVFDNNGNPVDSGKSASDFATANHTHSSTTIADGAITTSKIDDGAVTTDKLAELEAVTLVDRATDGDFVGKRYRLSILDGRLVIEEVTD